MTAKFKVVVTDSEYVSMHHEREQLEKLGGELILCHGRSEEEIIANAADADGIMVQYGPITRRIIENLPKLRAIVRYGIGIDCVDVKAATEHGIMVANVPDYGLQDVADHTVALLLTAVRKIVPLNAAVKSGVWDFNLARPAYRLQGKTLGLVAFGTIARMVAQRVRPFGVNVQVHDPYLTAEAITAAGATSVDLETLMATSDYISLHTPLSAATHHMINADMLSRVKPTAILVNTARGGLIDETALVAALESGKLGGAALDVTSVEPINPDNPLLKLNNVIITPHAAWYTEEAQDSLQYKAGCDMARAMSGQVPINILNPECLSK